jgi:hypothetical protein
VENQSLIRTLAPFVVIGAVLAFRLRKMTSVQPMKLNRLWVRPVIIFAISAGLLIATPPESALQVLALFTICGVGAVAGWHQAKLMTITVAESGELNVKASRWGLVTLLGIILLRTALRPWLTGPDSPVHVNVGIITDGFILFIAGFYAARSTEMFIRGRALLASRVVETPEQQPANVVE